MIGRVGMVAALLGATGLGAIAGQGIAADEVKTTTMEGYRIAYREAGEGPPVILIHGLAASSAYWKETIGPLSASHHVYAIDLLGFGDSEKPSVDYTIEGYVEQIAAFMQKRGIERADLVGHSLGGTIAALFAAEYPWKVGRLALVDMGGLTPGSIGWLARLSGLPVVGDLLMSLRTRGMVRRVLRTKVFLNPDLATDEAIDPVMQASGRAYGRLFRDIRCADIRPALKRLRVPTLVVWGAKDALFPPVAGREAASLIEGARFIEIPAAAHIPQLENPKSFNAALLDFLSGP